LDNANQTNGDNLNNVICETVTTFRRKQGITERKINELFETNSKVKIKLSLCLTKHHSMKACWGVEV
jgi:predicted nucleic acid-binding protein